MILSHYIKRVSAYKGMERVRFWHNKNGWCATEAKGYSTRQRAAKVLAGLIKNGKAFSDECTIEESII